MRSAQSVGVEWAAERLAALLLPGQLVIAVTKGVRAEENGRPAAAPPPSCWRRRRTSKASAAATSTTARKRRPWAPRRRGHRCGDLRPRPRERRPTLGRLRSSPAPPVSCCRCPRMPRRSAEGAGFASGPAGRPWRAALDPAVRIAPALQNSKKWLYQARSPAEAGFRESAGGGPRTPDTRIMIPLDFGLAVGDSGAVGHAVGHGCIKRRC